MSSQISTEYLSRHYPNAIYINRVSWDKFNFSCTDSTPYANGYYCYYYAINTLWLLSNTE